MDCVFELTALLVNAISHVDVKKQSAVFTDANPWIIWLFQKVFPQPVVKCEAAIVWILWDI